MRLLLVTPVFPPDIGRLETYVKAFSARLAKRHQVTVVTYGEVPERVADVRVVAVSKGDKTFRRLLRFTFRLWREAKGARALFVYDGASVGVPALVVGGLRGIPVVRCVMDDEAYRRFVGKTHEDVSLETFASQPIADRRLGFIHRLEAYVLKKAQAIVMPSAYLRELFAQTYRIPMRRAQVLPYPPEPLRVLPFHVERLPYRIFMAGAPLSDQAFSDVLKAFADVRQRFPAATLVLTDQAALSPERRSQLEVRRLLDAVDIRATISSAEMAYFLRSSGVYRPLRSASVHFDDVFQAFEARVPVIAIDVACYREVITTEVNGILIPGNQPEALGGAMNRVFADAEFAKKIVDMAEETLDAQAGWDRHVQMMTTLV